MFREKYKKATHAVKMTDESREAILQSFENPQKKVRARWLVPSISVVACLCLVFTFMFTFGREFIFKSSAKLHGSTDTTDSDVCKILDYSSLYAMLDKAEQSTSRYYNGIDMVAEVENDSTPKAVREPSTSSKDDYSKTNTQVADVDESDIIKTNGKQIYLMNNNGVSIFSADAANTKLIASISLDTDKDTYYTYLGMYLYEDLLVMHVYESRIENYYPCRGFYCYSENGETHTLIYDISDPHNPEKLNDLTQDGLFNESRLTGGILYTVSNFYAYNDWKSVDEKKPETYVPSVSDSSGEKLIAPTDISILDEVSTTYCVITSIDMSNTATIKNSIAVLGNTSGMYASESHIVLYFNTYDVNEYKVELNKDGSYEKLEEDAKSDTYVNESATGVNLYLLTLNDGNIAYNTTCKLQGSVDDQFSIDEYNGYFRIVTNYSSYYTVYTKDHSVFNFGDSSSSMNNLYVLDSNLSISGSIENIAEDEYIKSARFMGDIGYFVTFRQTDPLFSVDLKDPKNPKIIGKLKIPGFSEYLQSYGDGLLFGFGYAADETSGGTYGLKLSMFNTTDPSDVKEIAYEELKGQYSAACDNHKAILADAEKNLIGFPGIDCYYIYTYSEDGFKFVNKIGCSTEWSWDMRGLYINNCYYVADVENATITVLDLTSFKMIAEVG